MTNPPRAHRARGKGTLSFYLVTVSTSRFAKMKEGSQYADESGDMAELRISEESHRVLGRKLISDDRRMIRSAVRGFLRSKGDVLLLVGGTGVSPRDVTVESVAPFFDKELVGFGELLRSISFGRIGSAAMLTRATAGTARGKLIVCLPGSPDAVDTALKNFLSEFPHVIAVAREGGPMKHGGVRSNRK
ncbi:MAG: MogA/MoaB family molybdenum cofactor biosynthesis protein [Thaumarchaeota archaeon]|nr:MogA/MoaB family molybdenum cofactor biosynthesis protein [Nitrososphaerota archaeon]